MPLPVLLWGAAAGLAATGIYKGSGAAINLKEAKEIGERAERQLRLKNGEVEEAREETNRVLERLGKEKIEVFTHQIKYIVDFIKKHKPSSSTINNFNESIETEEVVKEMEKMVKLSLGIAQGVATGAGAGALAAMGAYGSVGALATASTGTAIGTLSGAAATNATLAWLGGGALSAGGFGMAGGMIALGGIVTGPLLAVGGFVLAGKAEEALTEAYEYRSQVEEAMSEMDIMIEVMSGIRKNAKELQHVITETVARFEKVKVTDDSDPDATTRMFAVATGLKNVLQQNIMDKDGTPIKGLSHKLDGLLKV